MSTSSNGKLNVVTPVLFPGSVKQLLASEAAMLPTAESCLSAVGVAICKSDSSQSAGRNSGLRG